MCVKVLIVDDDELTRFALRKHVGKMAPDDELSIEVASSLAEAIAIIDNDCPDIILLDLGLPDIDMPGQDGNDDRLLALKATKEYTNGASVIVYTGDDDPDISATAMINGATACVLKERQIAELKAAILACPQWPREHSSLGEAEKRVLMDSLCGSTMKIQAYRKILGFS